MHKNASNYKNIFVDRSQDFGRNVGYWLNHAHHRMS